MKWIILLGFLTNSAVAATLFKVIGEVSVNAEKASQGYVFKEGDKLLVEGKKSIAIVLYKDGTKFLLKDGQAIISKDNKKEREVNLIKGILTSYVNKLSKKRSFGVKTKNSTMGVRGTKFWVEEKEDYSYLCVCEGEVSVTNEKSSVIVKRNQDVHISSINSDLAVKTANDQMWQMAVDTFKMMDVKVKPLAKYRKK